MTYTIDTKSTRRPSLKLLGGVALAAMLALGAFAAPARADSDDYRGYRHNWNGGYYRAPPVVYGSPYGESYYGDSYYGRQYNPPPVVYGFPGIQFNIR